MKSDAKRGNDNQQKVAKRRPPTIPKDSQHDHEIGPDGTILHSPQPGPDPNYHHHMVTRLYAGFDDDGTGGNADTQSIPPADSHFQGMASGPVGIIADDIEHGHNWNGSIQLGGCKGVVVAHWPNGLQSPGTVHIFFDTSGAPRVPDGSDYTKPGAYREYIDFLWDWHLLPRVKKMAEWGKLESNQLDQKPKTGAGGKITNQRKITIDPSTGDTEIEIENIPVSQGSWGDATIEGTGIPDAGPRVDF